MSAAALALAAGAFFEMHMHNINAWIYWNFQDVLKVWDS
jgi:hypothetical protein